MNAVEATVSGDTTPAIPFAFARRHGVVVLGMDGAKARVACRPDASASVLTELRRYLACPLSLTELSVEDFDRELQRAYERGAAEAESTMQDIGADLAPSLDAAASGLGATTDLLEAEDDAPIIRLINALLAEAIRENASDIHIEPFEGRLAVRLRVDGVMRKVLEPPLHVAPLIVSRIKVMAKLDIAEKRLPQDGRISVRIANRPVDVRVSTLPSGHGERVVLRLLDKQAGRLKLEQIGMDPVTTASMDELIRRPHGIILVTGPTGSGKTTTLYASLSRLNDSSRNVMTVEDPIEYYLDGIAQSQVNTKVDLTFARGLRAILRQDPDVVMVGEIRDLETAQIAVQASLTGHLVLSTLHTNTAVGAVTRLRDMGIEPFLLASSLIGVIAQRLVRVLCEACKAPFEANAVDCKALSIPTPATPLMLYRAVGCPRCKQLGYRGRTSIYELVLVDEAMRTLIHDGAGEQTLEAAARSRTRAIIDSGREKVLAGLTTLEEVGRVTREG
jgi:general secretion pathway protein E